MIILDGYNGILFGFENVCEDDNNVIKFYVLYVEVNVIIKIVCFNNSSDGVMMYVIVLFCIECVKLIIQVGIK